MVWRHGWKYYGLLRDCNLVVALVTGRNVWLLLSHLWILWEVGLTSLVVVWSSVSASAAVVTRVSAPVETAEGVADAVRVGLTDAPTIGRFPGTKLDGRQIVHTGTRACCDHLRLLWLPLVGRCLSSVVVIDWDILEVVVGNRGWLEVAVAVGGWAKVVGGGGGKCWRGVVVV